MNTPGRPLRCQFVNFRLRGMIDPGHALGYASFHGAIDGPTAGRDEEEGGRLQAGGEAREITDSR